jgi:hypothetical protein
MVEITSVVGQYAMLSMVANAIGARPRPGSNDRSLPQVQTVSASAAAPSRYRKFSL